MAKAKDKTAILPKTETELFAIVKKCIDKEINFTLSYQKYAGLQLTFLRNGSGDKNIDRAARLFKNLLPSTIGTTWGKTFKLNLSAAPDKTDV